jgi:hypothetical protein
MKEVGHRAARDRDSEAAEALLQPVDRDRVAALKPAGRPWPDGYFRSTAQDIALLFRC